MSVPVPALAEQRIALVIGNSAYTKVAQLPNPTRDATAIESLLRSAGFELVLAQRDLGALAMRRSLRDFAERAREADIAVIFYAGHGIEVNGTNYLVPVDAVLERDIDVEDEAIPLDRLIQILEPAKRLRLVILDACRENPFVSTMKRTIAGRSIGRGLAKVDVLSSDTLIAFAAKAGSTALDGSGTNSPYTSALLHHITTPDLDLRLALGRVRDEVLKNTGGRQEPFVYGSLGGSEIALVATQTLQQLASATPRKPAVDYDKEMEISFWNVVKDAKSKDLLQTYLNRYPAGNFAELAKVLIEQLDREQNATRLAEERDSQARLAEAARIAAGAKQADESRKADDQRRAEEENRTEALQRAEAEARAEAQRANNAMRKAEADRLIALKQAEEARREADAARVEQQRLAKLTAEASRKPTTVGAALPPEAQPPVTAKAVDDAPSDQVKVTRAVQTELKRVGCDPGEVNGKWGNKSKDALRLFARVTKLTLPTDEPTEAMLWALKNREGRICPLNCEPDEREVNSKCVAKLPLNNFGHKVGAQGEATSKHQRESTTTVDACISKCLNEGKAWKGVSCRERCRYGVPYGN